jgi:hypothetical protein
MSATKAKGTRLERAVADYLAAALNDDRIDRMPLHGKGDRGDIAGVRTILGEKVTIECKSHNRLELAQWVKEAETERGNADAHAAAVVHKRRGKGDPADQYVTMTLRDLAVLLGAQTKPHRPDDVHQVVTNRIENQ